MNHSLLTLKITYLKILFGKSIYWQNYIACQRLAVWKKYQLLNFDIQQLEKHVGDSTP